MRNTASRIEELTTDGFGYCPGHSLDALTELLLVKYEFAQDKSKN